MYTLKKPINVALDIRTLKDMWKAAIQMQEQGVYDTDAMYSIYTNMNPKLTVQNISDVCSGVYADTYWNTTSLDATLLAKSLVQAIGIERNLANSYANRSISQWRGILCRKNISDIGQIPVTTNYTASLDIVCNQNTPIDPKALITNWNNEYWKQPSVGKNFIYARCQNMAFDGPIKQAQVQMFYSTGGFNQPPSSWIQCFTVEGNNTLGKVITQDGQVSPLNYGDRGCSEAFYFNPTSQDHVCVISAVISEFFATNNPKQISPGNWNSVTWITRNGAAAWHNVDPQKGKEDHLAFFNQDGSEEKFCFSVHCKNVPVGSKIRLKSDHPDLRFDSGEVTVQHPAQVLKQTVTVPAAHHGLLKITLTDPNGNCLPPSAAAEVQMDWVLPHTHQHYSDGVELLGAIQAFKASQDIYLNMGSFTLLGSGK